MRASGSCGCRHSVLRPFFGRLRSSRARSARVGVSMRDLRQPRQKVLIRLARVAPHDAPQRRVGFQRRRIDADGLALDEAGQRQHLQDPGQDGTVGLQIDQAAAPRDRRVLGRRLVQSQAHEATEGQRIRRAPRDPALGIDPFEVPDQQQSEIGARRQARSPARRRVEPGALGLDEVVERVVIEDAIQPLVERVPAGRRQVTRRNPQPRRAPAVLAPTHGHAGV